jgi:endonuclease/exonuclease/phosphatase family metal-dependent hydrolase
VFRIITRGFLLTLNGICAFIYLLSATAPFISTAKVPLMGFVGLAFPFLLLLMLAWLAFWLFVSAKYSLISIIVLLLSSYSVYHYFSFNFSENKIEAEQPTFSLMTYNVKVFDLYNWTKNEESSKKILKDIFDADADIVCIQEFYSDNSEAFNMLKKLSAVYPHSHIEITLTLRGTDKWGIATFSKFPIRRKETIRFKGAQHNLAIASDIFINGKPVKIYNTHLQSIHLNEVEIESIENISDTIKWYSMDNVFLKMRKAYAYRAGQADKLKASMNRSSSPVIIAGDFNDTPNSYVYRTLSKNLNDTFDEAGFGIGQTYFGKLPAFRIDYILADKKMEVLSHKVIRNNNSDHYAVKAVFTME